MANSTIPGLVAVSVPALTDLFGVRQSGDSRDKKLTATQLQALIGGGGDVVKVGTPANTQLGVWTGDGTLEGESELTYVNAILTFSGVNGKLRGSLVNSGAILNEASSSINPTLLPNVGDTATGIGGSANNLAIVVRGVAGTRWQHSTAGAGEVRQFQDLTSGLSASTTQTQGQGILNGAAFSEITTVANEDDVVTLHNTGGAEYWTTIINTGANRLQIFPPVGDLILPGALNASITLDVNKVVTLYTLDGTNWIRLVDPAAGGGDVTASGTPVSGEIPVWTSGTDIKGSANDFVYNGAVFKVVCSQEMRLTGDLKLQTGSGQAPLLRDVLADETTPTLCPAVADTNTGIGWKSADRLAFIAGGKRAMVLAESNGIGVIPAYDTGTGLTAFAGGGQGSAITLDRGYNVVTTVATTADSVKLPDGLAFLVGSVVYLKNNGANSLDLFPASGDNLGAGVDTAISVAAGASVAFLGTAEGSTWTQLIFAAGGGGGDVTKVGTPLDNQLAVWTGDGTLEGDSGYGVVAGVFAATSSSGPAVLNENPSATNPSLVPSKTDLDTGIGQNQADQLSLIAGGVEVLRVTEAAGVVQALVPAGIEASPSYSFINDPDTGFINETNVIVAVTGASRRVAFSSAGITSVTAGNFAIRNEVPSGTNPVLTPAGTDADTGIGTAAADQLSLIAGGVEIARCTEAGEDQFIVSPGQFLGSSALPSLAFGDGDTGFVELFDDVFQIVIGGVARFNFADAANSFQGAVAGAGSVRNEASSATNPTLGPSNTDADTGIGAAAADQLSLIAGGVEIARASEGTNDQLLVISGVAAGPGIGFISDPDTGFFLANTGTIEVSLAGTSHFEFLGTSFGAKIAGGARIVDELPSATNPSFVPNKSDTDTGIGWNAANQLSLIAGGVEGIRLAESEGSVVSSFIGVFAGVANSSPQLRNIAASATVPTLIPNKANATSGIGQNAAGEVSIIGDGVEGFRVAESGSVITNTIFGNLVAAGGGGAGPAMLNVSASPSVPTFVPNQADPDTGLTRDAVNGLSMVAGGLGCIRARNIGSARAVGFYTTTPIVQQTGVAVTDVAIHAALVALGLITA